MKSLKLIILLIAVMFFANSCKKDDTKPPEDVNSKSTITDLKISDDFDFETSKRISVSFSDDNKQIASNSVKYEIYLYDTEHNTKTVTYLDENGINSIDDLIGKVEYHSN